eukprot:3651648-Prymnesium_polylepis.1
MQVEYDAQDHYNVGPLFAGLLMGTLCSGCAQKAAIQWCNKGGKLEKVQFIDDNNSTITPEVRSGTRK